jgi:uncharacterized membrane protein
VSAATISGNIYDLDLEKVNNVLIEIDTSPKQTLVVPNGAYSITIPIGTYTLTAKQADQDLLFKEPLAITQEGDFVMDLVLMPSFEDIDLLSDLDALDFEINGEAELELDEPYPVWPWLFVIFVIIVIAWVKFRKPKVEKKEEDETAKEANEVLKIIKKEGRMTQRELRNKLPSMSEAKVSLILTELEHDKKIQKIKKGRGNVIIAK